MNEFSDKKSKNGLPIWTFLILILIFGAVLAILISGMSGQITVTGGGEDYTVSETIVCESETTAYPLFTFDNSDSKNLKINAFFEDDVLHSIALYYRLDYSDIDMAKKSESVNHGNMNLSFYDDGMETDDLNAKYSFIDNSLQMSIYIKSDEFGQKPFRYFMLNNIYNAEKLTKEKMAKIYNEAGLDCVIKNKKTKEEVNEN